MLLNLDVTAKHETNLFSTPPLEEWLLYFKQRPATFEFTVTNGSTQHVAHGRCAFLFAVDLSISIAGFARSIKLQLESDKTKGKLRRFFGTAPLLGDIFLNEEPTGRCITQNSHKPDIPVIRVENRKPAWALEAYRAAPKHVSCPLLVFGLPGFEVVLEDYYTITRELRRRLPDTPLRRHFVGSCRAI